MAGETYSGETEVLHYLELLRDKVGYDKIKEIVAKNEENPLKGKRIAAYYGCLLLRPNSVMKMDDPENPTIIENLISAMGATPVVYPYRNECCGGYIAVENKAEAKKKCDRIMQNVDSFGADMVVTACPLCRYNLDKSDSETPVVYFTELLALALGIKKEVK
jgi:heterodisulfide reductase subunit B